MDSGSYPWPPHRRQLPEPKLPRWFKVWFVVCAGVAGTVLGVGIWAVYKLVNHATTLHCG